jgi:hypothetical protein
MCDLRFFLNRNKFIVNFIDFHIPKTNNFCPKGSQTKNSIKNPTKIVTPMTGTKKFCLKLGKTTTEYDVEIKGTFLTIKKLEDIVRLKKELIVFQKIGEPTKKKATMGDFLDVVPRSVTEIRSMNQIQSFADLDELDGTPGKGSMCMPSSTEFLERKNHLVFNVFGHLDIYSVAEKATNSYYLEMKAQHKGLCNTL